MNEFEQKDYEGARNSADQVKTTAENIMSIFDNMSDFFGNSCLGFFESIWQNLTKFNIVYRIT